MYCSTRSSKETISAKEAILRGISPDGGLYVIPSLKDISIDLNLLVDLDFSQIAEVIYTLLLDDFSPQEIKSSIKAAYTGTFDDDIIAPVKKVGSHFVLELWHGPTAAFKDVALTMLPQLLSKALKTANKKALILTATSGDTGKAAMSGFADVDKTGICVYYPHGGVSPIQKKQMSTQVGSNVDVFAIRGNFDDAQRSVKQLFVDNELKAYAGSKGVTLSSANSINIGRLIPQIVYYFSAYIDLVKSKDIKLGDTITYVVPTGNFGDVLAGYYAHVMGLPSKFVVAANKNNVLDDFIKTGTYDRNREFFKTISPSMDILVSSNLERLLYYATDCDSEKISTWMSQLEQDGKYTIDNETLKKIQSVFTSGTTNEIETHKTIRSVYSRYDYTIDTHTAVAYNVAEKAGIKGTSVVLSTASPYKFPVAVMESFGESIDNEWRALSRLEEMCETDCPQSLADLESAKDLHKKVISQGDMKASVKAAIDKLSRS